MIGARGSWFLVMLGVSAALHLGGAVAFGPAQHSVEIEGGGQAAVAQLGASFADLVAGQAGAALPSPPPAPLAPVEQQNPDVLAPSPAAVQPSAVQTASAPSVDPVLPLQAAPPVLATPREAAPVEQPPQEPTQAQSAQRPQTRPAEPPVQAPVQPPVEPPSPAQPRASGNAARDAQRGDATGEDVQADTAAGAQVQSTTSGQLEARRFPSLVLRQIQRTRRERVNARGVAVVAFSIGAGGQLTSVSIARSSGSAELDRAALDHLRRAAPFPAPPAQAQTQFSFEFMGR